MIKKLNLSTFKTVSLVFFLYVFISYFVTGITTTPFEGDSLAYHIPLAEEILEGNFIHPTKDILHFYPGIGDAILSFFLLFNIPLNIFNVLGIGILFFFLKKLGIRLKMQSDKSTIFAISICLLHLSLRWMHTQTVDIYLAIFFTSTLLLLLKPENTWKYFGLLGISTGLLIGTKFSSPAFTLVLFLMFSKNFLRFAHLSRLIVFAIPTTLLGLFWYIRNYIHTGNPFYPQPIFGLQGAPGWSNLEQKVGDILIKQPFDTFNAGYGEYTLWIFTLLLPIIILFTKSNISNDALKLCALGLLNFAIYLFLPSTPAFNMIVSSFRYTYPIFIPLIAALFVLSKNKEQTNLLAFFALINWLALPSLPYHPKILFILAPILLGIIYLKKIVKLNRYLVK